MKVIIDSREQPIWKKRFEDEGFEVTVEALPIGDFYLPEKNIIFEHKTVGDFCQSIIGKHLQKQMLQQEENYENSYLIITGCWQKYARFGYGKFKTKEYTTGFIAHLRHYKKTITLPVEFDTHVPLIIKKIYLKSEDSLGIRNTQLLKSKLGEEEFKIRLLMSFNNVGLKKAEEFIKHPEVNKAIEEFVAKLEGIGIKKLYNIIQKHKEELKNGTVPMAEGSSEQLEQTQL